METKTWFKRIFTDDEFADIVTLSKNRGGISIAAKKYECKKSMIWQRLKSNNTFKGIPSQNKIKYVYNDSYFKFDKDEMYYLMGLLASDGCVTKNGRLSLNQSHLHGRRLIYFVKGILNSNHAILQSKNSYFINLKIESELQKQLNKFNIVNNKTYIYTLPKIKCINKFYFYLQGYIEGDGCLGYYDNGNGSFSLHFSIVGTEDFIKNVHNRLPLKGHVSNIKNKLFQLTFNGYNAFKILNIIYNKQVYVHGKYNIFKNVLQKYSKIHFIEKTYKRVLSLLSLGKTYKELSERFKLKVKFLYNLKWKKDLLQKKKKNITNPKD